MTEQAVHPVGGSVAGRTRIDHHDRTPRPGQHQGAVQAGGAAADHHDVIRVHEFIHHADRSANGGYSSVSSPT